MKKIEIKPVITTVLLIIFQSLMYLISRLFESHHHLIGNTIDTKIPFNIWFMIPYCLWYILIFVVPYYLYKKDKDNFIRYIYSYIICTLIANIIFVIYPTTVARPEITGKGILEFITSFIFKIDSPPMNCFPSLHCAMSTLFILFILEIKNVKKIVKITITLISILIMISTLYTKQHVFIDLISGDILAIITYIVVKIFYKENIKFKKLLKS